MPVSLRLKLLCLLFAQLVSAQNFTVFDRFGSGINQGVAWGDYNRDGYLDLFVTGKGFSHLYRNLGNNNFSLTDSVETLMPYGVAWADYDNNGTLDFAIGDSTGVLIYNGNGIRFTLLDFKGGGPVRGLAWGDYNNDGFVDLAVANFGQPSQLYRNDGAGHFIEVPNAFGSVADSSNGIAWADYNNDGWLDLIVANYKGSCRLFKNQNGIFRLQPFNPFASNSYGVAWGDYNNDGWLDLIVTNYADTNRLYQNINGVLTDAGGIFSTIDNSIGAVFGDFNNDGYLDFAIANCNSPDKFYRNDGVGSFTEIPFGAAADSSFGFAGADYDNDGDLDLAVANHGQNRLYRNDLNNNSYIEVRLVGLGNGYTNRCGIGARALLYKAGTNTLVGFRELNGGSGFSSMDGLEAHFGVAPGNYDLVVRWPASSIVDSVKSLSAPDTLTVVEDRSPPKNPDSVWSTTHTPAVWNKNRGITMVWSGASDPQGSGISGYACSFDTLPAGTPADTILVNSPDTVFTALLDYDSDKWFFHIRTKDKAGNWAPTTLTAGPFWIDATRPNPPDLISPPDRKKIHDLPTILNWHQPDDLSGINNYWLQVSKDSSFIRLDGVYYDSDTTAVLVLSPGKTYFWRVSAFDLANNLSNWSSINSFTIDTVPPSVIATSPRDGDTGVPLAAKIIVTFEENDIDPTTVNESTFTVMGQIVGPYEGQRYPFGGNYIFTPDLVFHGEEWITCLLTKGIKDSAGNSLRANYSWRFKTGKTKDTVGPITSQVTAYPDTTEGLDYFILKAKVSDVGRGESGILQAEYFMDFRKNPGQGTPMDGIWFNPEVEVSDTVYTDTISLGSHIFFVHGYDASGNWGDYDSVLVWITPVPIGPKLSVVIDPDTINIGDTVTVSASSGKPLQQKEIVIFTSDGIKINQMVNEIDLLHFTCRFIAVGTSPGLTKVIADGVDSAGNYGADTALLYIRNPDNLLPRNRVYVWPNPINSEIAHFRYFVTRNADVKLSIYTLTGTLIIERSQVDAGGGYGGNEFTLNLANLPNDLYIFKIEAKTKDEINSESVIKKFVLTR